MRAETVMVFEVGDEVYLVSSPDLKGLIISVHGTLTSGTRVYNVYWKKQYKCRHQGCQLRLVNPQPWIVKSPAGEVVAVGSSCDDPIEDYGVRAGIEDWPELRNRGFYAVRAVLPPTPKVAVKIKREEGS